VRLRIQFVIVVNSLTIWNVARALFETAGLGSFEIGAALTVIFAGVATCTSALNRVAVMPHTAVLVVSNAVIAGVTSSLTALIGFSLMVFLEGHLLGGAWWFGVGVLNVLFLWSQRKWMTRLVDAERKSIQDQDPI
jgi:hypothetical protein